MNAERSLCPWCEVRYYDASRFDHCYWCHRILTEDFWDVLPDYLERGTNRTGNSLFNAADRMAAEGLITDPMLSVNSPPANVPQVSPAAEAPPMNSSKPRYGRKTVGILCALFALAVIAAVACQVCSNPTGAPTPTDVQTDRLEHCDVAAAVKPAIQQRLYDPDSFEWVDEVAGQPGNAGLDWGEAEDDGLAVVVARVRERNAFGEWVESEWRGFIARDTCQVADLWPWPQ